MDDPSNAGEGWDCSVELVYSILCEKQFSTCSESGERAGDDDLFLIWCCPRGSYNITSVCFCHKQLRPPSSPRVSAITLVKDLFSKDDGDDVAAAHVAPWPLTAARLEGRLVHAAAIASYHTRSYCARQAITRSIYKVAADIPRAWLRLMCDIMKSLHCCHSWLTNPIHLPSVGSLIMNILTLIDWWSSYVDQCWKSAVDRTVDLHEGSHSLTQPDLCH